MSAIDRILELEGRRLSDEQRAAVESRVATIVSAGAGSGKTTVLSYRFLDLILSGEAHSDEILTLTFTKKAAFEMFTRIRGLLEIGKEDGNEILKNELENYFPRSQISTMDSFWATIARSASLSYGIAENFEILSDQNEDDFYHMAIEEVIGEARDRVKEGFDILSEIKKRSELDKELVHLLKGLNIFSLNTAEDQKRVYSDFIDETKNSISWDNRFSILMDALENLENTIDVNRDALNKLSKDDSKRIDRAFGEYDFYKESYLAIEKGDLQSLRIMEDVQVFGIDSRRTKAARKLGAAIDKYNNALLDFKSIASLEDSEEERYSVSLFIEALLKRVNEEKRKRSLLTYGDIAELSKRILTDNEEIRSYFSSRFKWIMVDEFQDDNSLQRDILLLLATKRGYDPDDTLKRRVDGKKLFFVGDDKQSIYRFRGADVSVFNSLRPTVVKELSGQFLRLSANYRSSSKIISHVNRYVEALFGNEEDEKEEEEDKYSYFEFLIDDYSEEYKTAAAKSVPSDNKSGSDHSHILFSSLKKTNKDDKGEDDAAPADSEAEYIAETIERAVSTDDFLIRRNGTLERPVYSDIAVLFANNVNQPYIERALKRHSIPFKAPKTSSATRGSVVFDIVSFLSLEVYPDDSIAYLSVLSSPMARLSSSALISVLNREDRSICLKASDYALTGEDEVHYEALRSLYAEVKDLLEKGEKITRAIDLIYYKSGYRAFLMSSKKNSIYQEHYEYLWQYAYKSESDGENIVSFVDSLRTKIGKDSMVDIDIERLNEEGVTLLTVHSAKGLEFPIVFYSFLSDKVMKSSQSSTAMINHGGEVALFDIKTKNDDESSSVDSKKKYKGILPFSKALGQFEKKLEREESKRRVYVALTRAADHLVVTASNLSNTNKGTYLGVYFDKFASNEKENEIEKFEIPTYQKSSIYTHEREAFRKESWYSKSPSPEVRIRESEVGLKAFSHRFDESDEKRGGEVLPRLSVDVYLDKNPSLRAYFGTLVHEAIHKRLFSLDYEYSEGSSSFERRIREELISEAERIGMGLMASGFYKSYMENMELEGEVPFMALEGDSLLRGAIDLVIHRPDSILIVDYKTDRVKDPDFHRSQVLGYMKAAEAVYSKPAYGTCLYVRDFSLGPIWESDLI